MLDTVQDCKEMSVGGFSNWFAKEADCGRPGRNRAAGQSKQGLWARKGKALDKKREELDSVLQHDWGRFSVRPLRHKLDFNISEDKPWGIEVPWAKI